MGQKITNYSSVSSNTPNKLSLIDVSELLPTNVFDTRKMTLQQLINYVNPIPYPSMTFVLSNITLNSVTLTLIKNTIGGSTPTVSVFILQSGASSIYTISHSSFTNTSSEYIIVHSGTSNTANGRACVYNNNNGQLDVRFFTDNTESINAMKQVVITYYKLN